MINARQLSISKAIDKLKQWQPLAAHVRVQPTGCECCHGSRYLTYTIMSCLNNPPTDETLENCGYYCPDCGFDAAGARKRK